MIRQMRIIYVLGCFLLAACSNTKKLPKDEKLYTGATVKISGTDDLTARERKVLRSDLQGLTRPKPNSRILGLRLKLSIYNFFGTKKENSFFGRLKNKLGEPPVLLSSVDLEHNEKVLQNHLENRGFFKAKVNGDTIIKAKRASAEYTVVAGNQYHINNVQFESDSSQQLTLAIQESAAKTLLKKGDAYTLDVIRGERLRIDAFLKERGYYFFGPDFLLAKVDSTVGNNLVDMKITVKPETPEEARQAYRINDVFIYSGYNINTANLDTNKSNRQFYKRYYVIDRRNRFKPKMFENIMQFTPGDLYNRTDHNLTLNRLINLNEFKFVRNRFEPLPDTAKLDAYYYLTPLPKKSLRGEVNATTKSNNLNGTQLSVNWMNRNTFRAGEQLNIRAYIGSEVQFGGTFKGYNTYRTGAEMNFVIPRFVIPFFNIKTKGGFVPRTNIQLGYDVLNRRKLYTVNSFRGGLGYLWKESMQKQHEFYPISINYVQPINVTPEYRDSIRKYRYLERIIDSQFILGSTYQYNFNQNATGITRVNSFYFNGLVDLSGNIAGLLTGANVNQGKTSRLFNAAFDQYIKLEADGRYYRKIGLKSTWANRLIIGFGHPYGNSTQLPYIKQFFAGGNNSIRAFRSRAVGPGTYRDPSTTFIGDQTGDLRFEANTEFRPHISGPIYGAIFLDAGNIWLVNEDPTRPGSKFGKDFLQQLAIGTGVGLRVDITLFVIRLDVGVPLHKPWEQNPWVMNQLRFNEPAWRRENMVFNLAIGYPF